MPLDPQARAVLDALAQAQLPDFSTLEPAAVRALHDAGLAAANAASPEPVARVEERRVPGPAGEIPVRLYAPEGQRPLPLVAYFHGGGFVICSLDTHDNVCRRLANESGCAVVSVDYRLAPEHRYPAAPEDCFAVLRWLAEKGGELGGDPERIAVAGDSAGGNLAAVVALMARDRGGPALRHQLLVYPVTDHCFETASYLENAEGYLLTTRMMRWFWGHYLEDPARGAEAYASPLRAPDLSGLPPATLITAEFDPLRDEGDAYAGRLREAGVPTASLRYDGVFHGFFSMFENIDAGRRAVAAAAHALREALA